MFEITKPTIKKLMKAIDAKIDLTMEAEIVDSEFIEDMDFSYSRLEDAAKGSKLISVNNLTDDLRTKYIVEEGYWIINNLAYYLCKPK